MRGVALAAAVAVAQGACGRIGFDTGAAEQRDGSIDGVDGSVNYLEPVGQLDTGFGASGYFVSGSAGDHEEGQDVIERAGGGYMTLGFHNGTTTQMQLIAITSNGQLDPLFGTGGVSELGATGNDYGYGMARLANGNILLVGDGGATMDDMAAAVIDPAGQLMSSFSGDGFAYVDGNGDDSARRGAVFGAGVIVCGFTNYTVMNNAIALVALRLDGTFETSFNGTGRLFDDLGVGYEECNDVIVDPSGNVVIAGTQNSLALIARFTAAGARDMSFGTGGRFVAGTDAYLYGAARDPSGDLIAVGEDNGSAIIVRVTAAGTAAPGFGTNGVVTLAAGGLEAVMLQPNGKFVAVGHLGTSTTQGVIMRRMPDGTPDPSFGTGGQVVVNRSNADQFHGLRIEPSGRILAVGTTAEGVDTRALIVRVE